MHAGVTLCVEHPFPDFELLMGMLKKHRNQVRLINIMLSRPHAEIKAAVDAQSNASLSQAQKDATNSVDIFPLLQHVCRGEGELLSSDFASFALAPAFQMLLEALGYGSFQLQPYAASGALTYLIFTEDDRWPGFVPLPRLFDMELLIPTLHDILAHHNAATYSQLLHNLATALKVKKAIKHALRPNIPADIHSAIDGRPSQSARILDNSQVVLIRHEVDVAALDLEHLCQPFELTPMVDQLLHRVRQAEGLVAVPGARTL
eukprot:m.914615 g.914615  ORF g.914615 m.914615 type:complete len:261 (-) comp60142_c0_seq8:3974-4756(-)